MTASQGSTTAEELRGAGLRVTAVRVALLETVRDGDHLGVEAIASGVRDRVGHVTLQAVYDALHALAGVGLVRRIEPAGSPARFEGRVGDNHHHIVCRSCGVVADVDCAVGEAPCLTPSDDHGFSVGEAEVVYWGLCPDCSPERSANRIASAGPAERHANPHREGRPGGSARAIGQVKRQNQAENLHDATSHRQRLRE